MIYTVFDFRICEYWPLPLLPPVPETLPRWEPVLSQGPSSLSTPCDHHLQGRPPCFSVHLQYMLQGFSTHLENFMYGHRKGFHLIFLKSII